MDQQQESRRWPTRRQLLWAGTAVALLLLIGAILFGYRYGITLWDWIKLLVVPAVIAGGGLWFNAQQRKREREIASDRAQDEALQAYLDHMSQLVTDKERPLHKARPRDNWSSVARARTFTALGRLDSSRKRSVMQFLYESGLIYKEGLVYKDQIIVVDRWGFKKQIIPDKGGLVERQYNIVSLEQADLRGADLSGAYLQQTTLNAAKGWTEEQLLEAHTLEGATMPNGQKYEDWLNDKERG